MADSPDPKASPDKLQQAAKESGGASFGRIIGAPFIFVGRLIRGKTKADEIVVYSAPPAFFLWIVIAVGFLLNLVCPKIITSSAGAWIFLCTLVYFLLAILYDMSLKKLLLWTLVIVALWLFAKYVENLRNIVIIGKIVRHFAALDPQYDPGTVSVLCWLLFIPWVASVFEMLFNRKKKFSPNEIAEFHFGEGSELTDRTGLRFHTKYRDVLETLLGFGGGDVLAVDNQQRVIKRFENVLGLWFHWDKMDRILQQRATLVEDEEKIETTGEDKPGN